MIKNQVRYISALIMLGFVAVLYYNYVLSLMFCMALMLPVILYGILYYVMKRTKIKLYSTVHISKKDEEIPIRVELYNPTIFPMGHLTLYLEYYNNFTRVKYKKKIRAYMDHKTNTTIIFYVHSSYIGNLTIRLKAIRAFDFIGLFSKKNKCDKSIQIGVLPNRNIISEENVVLSSVNQADSETFSPHKSGDDPSEVYAIRGYKEGDRVQRIHWKLSSKMDQIMIKEFSDPMDCSVLILLDLLLTKEEYGIVAFDGMLEEAISQSFMLIEKGIRHYIAWFDCNHGKCDRMMINTERDLYELLHHILQGNFYCQGSGLLDLYGNMYERDHYALIYSYHTAANQIDYDALMKISGMERQVIVAEVSSFSGDSSMNMEGPRKNADGDQKDRMEKQEDIGQSEGKRQSVGKRLTENQGHIEGIAEEFGIAYRKIKLKPHQGDWSVTSVNRKQGR